MRTATFGEVTVTQSGSYTGAELPHQCGEWSIAGGTTPQTVTGIEKLISDLTAARDFLLAPGDTVPG